MPGSYTHLYIADLIIERLKSGQAQSDGSTKLDLNPIDGSSQPYPIIFDSKLADILQRNAESFRAGAVSPDFFPDVFTGIIISHQPEHRNKVIADFMSSFANSIELNEEAQIAYWLGWFSHICTDIFGHHWLGMVVGDDFETWVSTSPDVIRKHLGTETVWDEWLRSLHGNPKVSFNRSLIIRSMLKEESTLCREYYNEPAYQPIHAMILVNKLQHWHKEREEATSTFKARLPKQEFLDELKQLCPVCAATGILKQQGPCNVCSAVGTISQTIQQNDPACGGVGTISQTIQQNDPACGGVGTISQTIKKNCPVCKASGAINEDIRGCKLCKGSGKINDPVCGGSGKRKKKVLGVSVSVPCPACLGSGGIPCPHNAGQIVLKVIKKTCPNCGGAKLIDEINQVTCPSCLGAKVINVVQQVVCPICLGAKVIDVVQQVVCPNCLGNTLIDIFNPCPICVSGAALTPLPLICDRLIGYHRRRQEQCQRLVETYVEAHEKVAICLVEGRPSDIPSCYETFLDTLEEFVGSQLSFTDLIAPELVSLEEKLRELVEKTVEELKQEFIPPELIELKRELIQKAVDEVSKPLNIPLSPEEKKHIFEDIIQSYPPDGFPPLVNAVSFFLLALDGSTVTEAGLVGMTAILNGSETPEQKVNNIDKRCQPFNTKLYLDSGFAWNTYFYDFLDGDASYSHCGETRRTGTVKFDTV